MQGGSLSFEAESGISPSGSDTTECVGQAGRVLLSVLLQLTAGGSHEEMSSRVSGPAVLYQHGDNQVDSAVVVGFPVAAGTA